MTRALALRPRAQQDLNDIWTYTAEQWSTAQAATYLTGLDAALQLLCDYPEMARLRAELSPPVRLYRYRAHLIVYLSDDATLDVLRVVHSRANWAAFLAE